MIEVKDLRKSYKTGDFVQKALDGVSLTFRNSEFVAVLGTSGSGKTTLLNIIGGLDHADSGEIVINGTSTEKYRSSDWDTYRNHEVGFVFQSYNLIPHQTVLSNVELALTLSGVGRAERQERARAALERVGLGEHIDKKPNQLSGGQAQRVAIARAIVNDPSIVLADEPTGALDTETGLQVMEILKELSKERLVVMVTHNPELANQYATRIVNLQDGRIIADSNPCKGSSFVPIPLIGKPRKTGKAGMSFLTALGLSFNNLMTKKGRTFMTALAGSIGIIGIAAILSLSNGVNNYILDTEEEALTSYPLTITKSSFDISSLLTMTMGYVQNEESTGEHSIDAVIPETSMMTDMFAQVKNNDLASFKEYLESGNTDIENYVTMIRYRYDITPNIYAADTSNTVVQLNPSKAMSSLSSGFMSSAFSMGSGSSNSFSEMMDNDEILKTQLDVVDGRWPESYDECMLVLDRAGEISDYSLYQIGVYDTEVMTDLMKSVLSGDDVEIPDTPGNFTYRDALDLEFKVLPSYAFYQKNEEQNIWSDISDNTDKMKELLNSDEAITLKVVGIVQPKEGFSGNPMSEGIAYRPQLTYELMRRTQESEIVKQQQAHKHHDVFTGKLFDELNDESAKDFDMASMFTVDEEKLQSAFSMDTSAFDFSDMSFDMGGIDFSQSMGSFSMPTEMDTSALSSVFNEQTMQSIMANAPKMDITQMDVGGTELTPEQKQMVNETSNELSASFGAWMIKNGKTMPSTTTEYAEMFQEYMNDDTSGASEILAKLQAEFGDDAQAKVTQVMSGYMENQFAPYLSAAMSSMMEQAASAMALQMASAMSEQMTAATQSAGSAISSAISGQLQSKMSEISEAMENGFSFDAEAFADAIQVNMSQEDLASLLTSYMNAEEISYDSNLSKLGYAEIGSPQSISIYSKDFEAKDKVLDIIDDYNDKKKDEGEDAGMIQYSDIAGTLMSSVSDIVNTISLVLIAFVSISLVVSSIMIGIITYISVFERRKEIGILRAMGASKGNIANVFNAETFIEGLVSGVLAIAIVIAVSFPVNAFVEKGFDVPNIMILPPESAAALIGVSVLLTFIAGLIPSQSASKRDPVEALRSE